MSVEALDAAFDCVSSLCLTSSVGHRWTHRTADDDCCANKTPFRPCPSVGL